MPLCVSASCDCESNGIASKITETRLIYKFLKKIKFCALLIDDEIRETQKQLGSTSF